MLSPHFFTKRWTRSELDGLEALERENRKIILPIWKDVSFDEVAQFSPRLAGIFAAKASDGVPAVVRQIKQATAAATRVASFSVLSSAKTRLAALDQKHVDARSASSLAESMEGIERVTKAATEVSDKMELAFNHLKQDLNTMDLRIERKTEAALTIYASYQLGLDVLFHRVYKNTISNDKLSMYLYRRNNGLRDDGKPTIFLQREYSPWFDGSGNVVWRFGADQQFSAEQIVDVAVDALVAKLEELHKIRQ